MIVTSVDVALMGAVVLLSVSVLVLIKKHRHLLGSLMEMSLTCAESKLDVENKIRESKPAVATDVVIKATMDAFRRDLNALKQDVFQWKATASGKRSEVARLSREGMEQLRMQVEEMGTQVEALDEKVCRHNGRIMGLEDGDHERLRKMEYDIESLKSSSLTSAKMVGKGFGIWGGLVDTMRTFSDRADEIVKEAIDENNPRAQTHMTGSPHSPWPFTLFGRDEEEGCEMCRVAQKAGQEKCAKCKALDR